jgi:hypothetical protein
MHIARGVKVAGFAELFRIARVISEFGIVKTHLHVAREGHRAMRFDFLIDLFTQAHGCSDRFCGVQVNISIM